MGPDRYVVGKYGGGGGKPKWIALDPPTARVPGPATTISRQIAPSVIEFKPANDLSWLTFRVRR